MDIRRRTMRILRHRRMDTIRRRRPLMHIRRLRMGDTTGRISGDLAACMNAK
jgi:hypothetical protein